MGGGECIDFSKGTALYFDIVGKGGKRYRFQIIEKR